MVKYQTESAMTLDQNGMQYDADGAIKKEIWLTKCRYVLFDSVFY